MNELPVVATGWMVNDSPSGLSCSVTFCWDKEWSVSSMALDSKVVKLTFYNLIPNASGDNRRCSPCRVGWRWQNVNSCSAGSDVPGDDRIVVRTGNGVIASAGTETVVRFDSDRLSSSVLLLAWFPVGGF